MTMHYGGTEIGQVYFGATEIGEAWVWDGGWQQVFSAAPPFARQRMNKTESQSVNGNVQLTGFTSDTTWPATVTSNALVVAGAGDATINWGFTISILGQNRTLQLRLNGVAVDSVTTGSATIDRNWSGVLAEGDLLTVWHTSGTGIGTVEVAHVDVIPT